EQRIRGFSFNLTGNINESLELMTGYTRLNDEQLNRLTGASGDIDNVAANTFSFWMNWIASIRFDLGVGARYVDERAVNNRKWVDDYWAFDAMLEYAYSDNLRFKLNLTNLTDEVYFDQLHPWHVIPGQGLTAVFAVNLDY
ncbi:MAG: TonB-dependent receptor, partial [Gammaproteobacteria bacterium]|nr:TonB-dependent receptor [Gammaproteobacteria bacterium]